MRKLPLRWKASNGARLVMRQMRANDAASVKVSLNKLSPLARRYRFFGPVREFTDQMVTRLVDVDPAREYALLLLRRTDGQEIPIGGGRFVIDASGNDCEFSLVVGDEWQGQRIGRHILRALIHEASRRGLNQMRGDVLSENAAMIALGLSLGFSLIESDEGPAVQRLILALDRPPVGILRKLANKMGRRRQKP